MKTEATPPTTTMMRSVQGTGYGDIDEKIFVRDGVPIPKLSSYSKNNRLMVVRTLSGALAPGDVRVLSGKTQELQGPPSFPYVPGGDCCGIVVDLPTPTPNNNKRGKDKDVNEEGEGPTGLLLPFGIGDRVAVRFNERNRDAFGQYGIVSTMVADRVPECLSSDEAAALASATPALEMARRIKDVALGVNKKLKGNGTSAMNESKTDNDNVAIRILVLGAGGGMGSHLCQLLRLQGVKVYICGVSKRPEMLLAPPISCDRAIDYTKDDIFEMDEFRNNPFDVVFDLAGGGYAKLEAMSSSMPTVLKPASAGGRFLTTVPPNGPTFEIHSVWSALRIFLFATMWKAVTSRTWYRRRLPAYSFTMNLSDKREPLTRMLELAEQGSIRAVLDPKGPFPFTTAGVREAFRLQESRHPHGKVVIHIADDDKSK